MLARRGAVRRTIVSRVSELTPLRSFGRPIETTSGALAETLFDASNAERSDAEKVAAWYCTDRDGVDQVVALDIRSVRLVQAAPGSAHRLMPPPPPASPLAWWGRRDRRSASRPGTRPRRSVVCVGSMLLGAAGGDLGRAPACHKACQRVRAGTHRTAAGLLPRSETSATRRRWRHRHPADRRPLRGVARDAAPAS